MKLASRLLREEVCRPNQVRFGEVFAAFQGADPASLPDAQEIIRSLDFINQQCEECSPPEWPE
jgi:hypothetical protein